MEVEVEFRSIIDKARYGELMLFFKKNASYLGRDSQVTHYLDDKGQLRLQKSTRGAKIWLKQGALHKTEHEEIEVGISSKDFKTVAKIFELAGKPIRVTWYRLRHTFLWKGVSIMLDYTRGYGYIAEFEVMCTQQKVSLAKKKIKEMMDRLNLNPTPKSNFDKKYSQYLKKWSNPGS